MGGAAGHTRGAASATSWTASRGDGPASLTSAAPSPGAGPSGHSAAASPVAAPLPSAWPKDVDRHAARSVNHSRVPGLFIVALRIVAHPSKGRAASQLRGDDLGGCDRIPTGMSRPLENLIHNISLEPQVEKSWWEKSSQPACSSCTVG